MLSADDKLAILETIARYNRAADDKDVEATATLYTADGTIDGAFEVRAGDSFRPDLQRVFDGHGSTLDRHLSLNHIFDGDGDGDRVGVDSVLLVVRGDAFKGEPVSVGATVPIRDEFHKTGTRWLVARHTVGVTTSVKR